MPTPARVVVCPQGPGPLRIEEVDLPDPGPHQVVVKQLASGVCHSQLHQMHGPRAQQQLLGHESTGIVLAAGSEVSHVREGDRVMVTWVIRDPDATRLPVAASLTLPDGSVAQSQNTFTWADNTIADEQYVVAMPAGRTDGRDVDHRLRGHDRRRRRLPHRGRAARRERRRLWRGRSGPLRDHRRGRRRRGPDHRRST